MKSEIMKIVKCSNNNKKVNKNASNLINLLISNHRRAI